jgi:hypothetical protein
MRRILGSLAPVLLVGLVLAQAQLLRPCGYWHSGYWQSDVWHQGFYVHRWCPLLPPSAPRI